jgi:hypothetical protein
VGAQASGLAPAVIEARIADTSLVLSLIILGALLLAAATGERTGSLRTGLDASIFLVLTVGGIASVLFAIVLFVLRLS